MSVKVVYRMDYYQENTEEKENIINIADFAIYLFCLYGMYEYIVWNKYSTVLEVQRLVAWSRLWNR